MKSRTMCFAPGRAAPGMTLDKPIADREGNTLLAAGTVLSSEMLERLIRRCIETVCVRVLDTRDDETIAGELSAASAQVDVIFRGQGSPARQELRAAILHYRLESTR